MRCYTSRGHLASVARRAPALFCMDEASFSAGLSGSLSPVDEVPGQGQEWHESMPTLSPKAALSRGKRSAPQKYKPERQARTGTKSKHADAQEHALLQSQSPV